MAFKSSPPLYKMNASAQLLSTLNDLLAAAGETPAQALSAVGGGSINRAFRARREGGADLFVKHLPNPPAAFYQREAEGLQALAGADGLRVPAVIAVSDTLLVLECIASAAPAADYDTQLAEGLARQHGTHGPHFGFTHDNYCGTTPQPNPACEDGFHFFAEHRLHYQARLAHDSGLLDSRLCDDVAAIGQRLGEWLPAQPPSLLHGDLWSGNIMTDDSGRPVLVDPACHWGWAEAEIAMTTLFGSQSEAFYRRYEEIVGLETGWRERLDLYNLYHLLNHLNLFGGSYHASVSAVIRRYR